MDMETSGRLKLPYIMSAQAQKHVTHNEAMQMLDAIVQLSIMGFEMAIPPVDPQDGEVYAISATSPDPFDWPAGRLAYRSGSGWLFLTPHEGWVAFDTTAGALRIYRAGVWQPLFQNLTGLGIGATSDSINRLAVAADATLFSHAGADHRLKVNKAVPGDTASLVFQSGWSGRAEMGLAGDDAFAIKVSADGTAFVTALSVNPVTGVLGGAAVVQSASDVSPGKVLTVGAGAAQLDPALYSRANVVGTVSHTAGLPTGSLIESGSNANGSFVRFADGTQICTRRAQVTGLRITTAFGSLFRTTLSDFPFPAAFASVDAVSATLMGSQNAGINSNAGVLKTRYGSTFGTADWTGITLWSPISVTGTVGEITFLSLYAIGRWF